MMRVGCYPLETVPANVPAFVEEHREARVVVISHPSNDRFHPCVTATIARYIERGWSCTFTLFARATA